MDARNALWRAGEDAAGAFYEDHGFRILARNVRVGRGEIDLIARRGDVVVFCEVKTRRTDHWGEPSEAVGYVKRAQLRKLAGAWLSLNRPGAVRARFDVVSVIVRDGRTELTHVPDAF